MISLQKKPEKYRNGYKDKSHRDKIRALPCIACKSQQTPTEAHHLIGYGAGLKPTDFFMIPLCNLHHTGSFYSNYPKKGNAIHATILSDWEKVYGIQENLLKITYEDLGMIEDWQEAKNYIKTWKLSK